MSIQSVSGGTTLDMATLSRNTPTSAAPASVPGSSPVLRNDAVRAADSAAAATAKAGNAANTQAAAPANGAPNTPANAAEPNREALLQAGDEVRKAIEPVAQDLLFSIDDDTGHTVVKVVDASTDEVIRQIPSAEVLAIAKALDKLQGVLIKQEA